MRVLTILLVLYTLPIAAQDMALLPFESDGFAAMKKGDFATCARIFSTAAAQYPAQPSPPSVAARCYAKAGDETRARQSFELALKRGFRKCAAFAAEPDFAPYADLRSRCERNAEAFVRESNPELLAAYLSDREDRAGEIPDPATVMLRDASRRNIVRIAHALRSLRTADDYLHAALVMQHGSTAEDIAMARDFARKAVELRPWLAEARWLYAASTDRYLRQTGKPQIFGTQYSMIDGQWTLEPFDPAAITDEERARWRAHSVAERRKFIDELNHPTDP
jgi:hypothetical protein